MNVLAVAKRNKFRPLARIALVTVALLMVTHTATANSLCETILQDAYKRLEESCRTLVRNQACYGNDAIRTELNAPYEPQLFAKVGDIAPLRAIREIYTLPMDVTTGTWGLSLLKVQTNLPDTAPGQNVIFILYGDTHLTNADDQGKMSAFYFTSGLGQPACKAAPFDGITIRSPQGTRVQFNANGVYIDIGSTVVLQASINQEMRIQLVEGSARITADNKTVNLLPGQSSRVPLGGIDGLQAIGTPSLPVSAPQSQAHQQLLGAVGQSAAPVNGFSTQPVQPSATPVFSEPTRTVQPTYTPNSPNPTNPSKSTYTPKPPKPTKPAKPTYTPKPPNPTKPGKPTYTPKPPNPTDPPKPTKTPKLK